MVPLLHALKRILAVIDFALLTLVLYLLTWIPVIGRGAVKSLFRVWCRAFVRALDVDLRLHQHHRAALPARFILIANHPSAFEDIGIPALFNVVSLAKVQVQDWFVVGRISKAAGTLFVDRDDPASRQQSIETMVQAVQSGCNIALYPEGGCKGRRLFSEFKSGAFEVAIRTGVPIVPVFLHYEAQDDFEWQAPYTLPQKLFHMAFSRNRTANYHVFDPIDPKGFQDKSALKAEAYRVFERANARFLE